MRDQVEKEEDQVDNLSNHGGSKALAMPNLHIKGQQLEGIKAFITLSYICKQLLNAEVPLITTMMQSIAKRTQLLYII